MLELFAHLSLRAIISKCSDGSRELGELLDSIVEETKGGEERGKEQARKGERMKGE